MKRKQKLKIKNQKIKLWVGISAGVLLIASIAIFITPQLLQGRFYPFPRVQAPYVRPIKTIKAPSQTQNLTRATAVKLLIGGAEIPLLTSVTPTFSDVDRNHQAFVYVETAIDAGIINGYPNGTFRPNNTITRAEFAKMATYTFGVNTITLTKWSPLPLP